MASLLTNAAGMTALQQLRGVQRTGEAVRSELSTGLKVQGAKDNPAFFLVSTKTKGDMAILAGLKENLALLEGTVNAAQTGIRQLDKLSLQIADMIPMANTGLAVAEMEASFSTLVGAMREIIEGSGFLGNNLLKDDGTSTSVIGLERDGSSYGFRTMSVTGGDFLRQSGFAGLIETGSSFVINAEDYSAKQAVGSNDWTPSATYPGFLEWIDDAGPNELYSTQAQVDANSPRLDYRVKINNPGRYYVNVRGRGQGGNADSIHVGFDGMKLTGNGGVNLPTNSEGWGTRETNTNQRVYIDIPAAGVYTINIWGREDGSLIDGVWFTDDPSEPSGATPMPPPTPIGGSDLPYFTDAVNGEARRQQAGFMELIELVNPEAMRLAPDSAMLILDAARAKLNRYASQIGAYEKTIERQRTYIDTLTDGLNASVASLIETDLAEASSRLQSIQVQEQLALQSLAAANGRGQLLLSLFRS